MFRMVKAILEVRSIQTYLRSFAGCGLICSAAVDSDAVAQMTPHACPFSWHSFTLVCYDRFLNKISLSLIQAYLL